MRGFMRSVWLLNPTTPSAGAGAAAQVPTQCLSLGKAALPRSALWSDPAAAVASTAMDFGGIVLPSICPSRWVGRKGRHGRIHVVPRLRTLHEDVGFGPEPARIVERAHSHAD